MSVVWTNLQIPTALALKPKVLNTAFKTLMILLSNPLWHHFLLLYPETITLRPSFPLFAAPQIHQEWSLVDPSAWNAVSQILTGLTFPFIQVSVQMSSYQKSLSLPACGKHNALFSSFPYHSLHPYPALFFIITLARHFLSPSTRIKASWEHEDCTVFYSKPNM